jgi:glutamine amidotransferase
MLSNGEVLFAHCATNLHYIIRQAPFNKAHLVDDDVTVDFSTVTAVRPGSRGGHQPLTDNENWIQLQPGQLLLFRDGAPLQASAA